MTSTVLDSLNTGLLQALGASSEVLLLGEDILDPYGGAFKVTKGCSTQFPQQVLTTPISEAGIAGVAAGLALRGFRPVVEVMFGDFITLMADQIINHISKFHWMYNGTVDVPMVIRAPMGGRRGYGPTHSQTLEKLFLGIPGLTVVAPNHLVTAHSMEPGNQLKRLILETTTPVVFVENKLQYLLPLENESSLSDFTLQESFDDVDAEKLYPIRSLEIAGAPKPSCTMTAYGYMSELCLRAMKKLAFENEIFCRLVIPTKLSPFETNTIECSARKTGNLVTVEEGTHTMGWGAEIAARVSSSLGSQLKQFVRIGAKDTPVPAAQSLEAQTLPQVDDIVETVKRMAGKND
jgi:pyruvate/2-oxoglutarate/acetoin dehydrogenase E1 component